MGYLFTSESVSEGHPDNISPIKNISNSFFDFYTSFLQSLYQILKGKSMPHIIKSTLYLMFFISMNSKGNLLK